MTTGKAMMTNDFITIVSGLPRSGTSLLMQMLQAAGLPPLTDGKRTADEDNPRGYFEHEAVKHTQNDIAWLNEANGKAVKVIHLLLSSLPGDRSYRVIFMLRDIEEVINSQRLMLERQGRASPTLSDKALAGVFEKQLAAVREWLAVQPNFSVLYLNHRNVIGQPIETARAVAAFLDAKMPVESMAAVVCPTLYRQRNAES